MQAIARPTWLWFPANIAGELAAIATLTVGAVAITAAASNVLTRINLASLCTTSTGYTRWYLSAFGELRVPETRTRADLAGYNSVLRIAIPDQEPKRAGPILHVQNQVTGLPGGPLPRPRRSRGSGMLNPAPRRPMPAPQAPPAGRA